MHMRGFYVEMEIEIDSMHHFTSSQAMLEMNNVIYVLIFIMVANATMMNILRAISFKSVVHMFHSLNILFRHYKVVFVFSVDIL